MLGQRREGGTLCARPAKQRAIQACLHFTHGSAITGRRRLPVIKAGQALVFLADKDFYAIAWVEARF